MRKPAFQYLVVIIVAIVFGLSDGRIWVDAACAQDLVHSWSMGFGDYDRKEVRGIAVDGWGNVIITGPSSGTVDFGGGPLTSEGFADCYIAKFSSGGEHLWSSISKMARTQKGELLHILEDGFRYIENEFQIFLSKFAKN